MVYKQTFKFDVVVVPGGDIRLVNGKFVSTPYEEGLEKSFGGWGRAVTSPFPTVSTFANLCRTTITVAVTV